MILDAISQALDGMGMSAGGDDEFGEGEGVSGDNTVPVWSQLAAGKLGQSGGPFYDKSALMDTAKQMGEKPPTVDQYGMPVDDQQSEMMTALGLV